MLVGTIVLAALVLLVLLAERLGSRLHGGPAPMYLCRACAVRYPRAEMTSEATGLRCPRRHPVEEGASGSVLGTALIFACAGFIVIGVVLVLTGAVPGA